MYLLLCAKRNKKITQKTYECGYLWEASRNGVERTEGIGRGERGVGGGGNVIFLSITIDHSDFWKCECFARPKKKGKKRKGWKERREKGRREN